LNSLIQENYPDVKITSVKNILLSRMHEKDKAWGTHSIRAVKADVHIVVVETDQGQIGYGEICSYGGPPVIKSWVEWFSRIMVGRSLSEAWRVARPRGVNWAHDGAAAGLDCAFWDILGQITGKTVAVLLGADPKVTEVDAYASGGVNYDWGINPDQLIDEVVGYKNLGFTTTKLRMGTGWQFDGVTPERFLALMKKLRDAVGPDFRLAVDGNARLNLEEALKVAKGLNDLGFIWFEDAIAISNIDGFKALQKVAPDLTISGGEVMQSLDQYRPYFEQGALQMLHPDAGWMGITEMKAVMEMAATYGISCDPHGWHNGAMAIMHAHIMAGAPLYGQVEVNFAQGPLRDAILADGLPVAKGKLQVPQVPGFGIKLADGLEEKFPYLDFNYHAEIMHPVAEVKPEPRNYF
jgi:L-alanine-DL-glutamate epimerase-like enolase superfamily enzyme